MSNIDHSINFLGFMQSFRRGELLRQGDDALQTIIAAIADNRRATANWTIKLPFKRNKAGADRMHPQRHIKSAAATHGHRHLLCGR